MAEKKAVISFRVTPDEWSVLEDAARAAGESVSDYVRRAIGLRQHLAFIHTMTSGADFTFYGTPGTVLGMESREARGTVVLEPVWTA